MKKPRGFVEKKLSAHFRLAPPRTGASFNLSGKSLHHVPSEFLLLSGIFRNDATTLFLGHIFTPLPSDFIHDPHQDFFRNTVSFGAMCSCVPDIATRHIRRALNGEGDAI